MLYRALTDAGIPSGHSLGSCKPVAGNRQTLLASALPRSVCRPALLEFAHRFFQQSVKRFQQDLGGRWGDVALPK